jgi:hypothetical protein
MQKRYYDSANNIMRQVADISCKSLPAKHLTQNTENKNYIRQKYVTKVIQHTTF